MPTQSVIKDTEELERFFAVALEALDRQALQMDLYIRPRAGAEPVLYRSTGVEFSAEDQRRLTEQGVECLYVPMEQHAAYRRALIDRLDAVFRDEEQERAQRARIIRVACTQMVEEAVRTPQRAESIHAIGDFSRMLAGWIVADYCQAAHLLDLAARAYETATHMVNVGVGCGLLMRELHADDAELQAVMIQGGLLHDIGKGEIPEPVLNKEGELDPAEWELIRRHPEDAYEQLRKHASLPDAVREMARDHHERLDGRGYPRGLEGSEVGLPARACAVVDAFDAICSLRPCRSATPARDTLKIMREGVGLQFDREALNAWTRTVERVIEVDPSRALPAQCAAQRLSLSDLLQEAPAIESLDEGAGLASTDSNERRRHARFACDIDIKAKFLRQGKRSPIGLGQWLTVRMADISQGGMQIRTPWPLTLNDVLALSFASKGDQKLKRKARVVRVRQVGERLWAAGLCFINNP
ncbi:MAG: PilZ domain-containing protein [Planctomycetes bacterium]|nr:PilZ domain-containing protein [Planctomycetota bacterium]